VAQLARQGQLGIDTQHLLRRSVRVEADGRGGQRRQRRRRALGRLDASADAPRRAPEEVLRREGAVPTEALLVAYPRVEAGGVRHLPGVLDHRGARVFAHPLLVLGHRRQLRGDAHAALARARLAAGAQVEGARAELLDQSCLGAALGVLLRAVVHGTLLRIGERVKGQLHPLPHRRVTAAVGMTLHRARLVRCAHFVRAARPSQAEQRIVRRSRHQTSHNFAGVRRGGTARGRRALESILKSEEIRI
jgi:hypothetical protein